MNTDRCSVQLLMLLLRTAHATQVQKPTGGDSRMERGMDARAVVVTKLDVKDTRQLPV
jgi:hypothetical protein